MLSKTEKTCDNQCGHYHQLMKDVLQKARASLLHLAETYPEVYVDNNIVAYEVIDEVLDLLEGDNDAKHGDTDGQVQETSKVQGNS